jgi:hypothetical protein
MHISLRDDRAMTVNYEAGDGNAPAAMAATSAISILGAITGHAGGSAVSTHSGRGARLSQGLVVTLRVLSFGVARMLVRRRRRQPAIPLQAAQWQQRSCGRRAQ